MDQQPKIPTLKDAQKPQVKIKGMGAGLTLFDRLKQFKKKDLAFILAGLGTLFMAPLAEHFMMAPEGGASDMSQGFRGGGTGGSNLFGSGSSPYENGNNSIAQGGAIGGAGDIITPLNVRDPSALVMGPGAAQQPPAGSVASVTPPPTAPAKSETDYKDALAGAASRAASAAVKRSPLPVPKIALGGSGGLRGLGAASGGSSSGSGSLGPINSGNLGQAGTGGGGLNLVRTNPNFRGAAGPRGNGPQGLDNTKKAGANAGDAFSRQGSAMSGLNAAAAEQIPTGGQGFGGGGQGGAGANDKPGGGAGAAGSKSVGESLAFIEAKERMMEKLKLEFEKKKLKDPELLMYGIRNDILKASAAKIGEGLTTWAMCKTPLKMGCPAPDSELTCTNGINTTSASLSMCGETKPGAPAVPFCWTPNGNSYVQMSGGKPTGERCDPNGKSKGDAKPAADTGSTTAQARIGPGVTGDMASGLKNIKVVCEKLAGTLSGTPLTAPAETKESPKGKPAGSTLGTTGAHESDPLVKSMLSEARALAGVRDAFLATSTDCEGATIAGVTAKPKLLGADVKPLKDQHNALSDILLGTGKGEGDKKDTGMLGKIAAMVPKPEVEGEFPTATAYSAAVGKAGELLAAIKAQPIVAYSGDLPKAKNERSEIEIYQGIIKESRAAVKVLITNYEAAQKLHVEKVMPALTDTVGEGTLKQVIAMNSDYQLMEDKLKGVTVESKKPGTKKAELTQGATDAKTAIGTAKTDFATIDALDKDSKDAAFNKSEPIKKAKAAVLGERESQTEKIAEIKGDATAAQTATGKNDTAAPALAVK